MTTTTPTETSALQTPMSRTLLRLEKTPATVCAVCPNALWHTVVKAHKPVARVYCNLMHALIDQELKDCDGIPDDSISILTFTEKDELEALQRIAKRDAAELLEHRKMIRQLEETVKKLEQREQKTVPAPIPTAPQAKAVAAAQPQAGMSDWDLAVDSDDL